jgi:hypothetical protein
VPFFQFFTLVPEALCKAKEPLEPGYQFWGQKDMTKLNKMSFSVPICAPT